jgi:hypothetical protein
MTPSLARHRPGTRFAGHSTARMGFGVALNISTTVYGLRGQVQTTVGGSMATGYCDSIGAALQSRNRIMAAILASLHMQTADDLFGGPQGGPRSDKLIAASVQWAERIVRKIDKVGATV